MKFNKLLENLKKIGKRFVRKNKYESLINDYNDLSKSHPNDMRIKMKIAETYFKAGNVHRAIEVYFDIADTYLENNFTLKAVAIYKNILKLDPLQVTVNLELADIYKKLDMPFEAVNQLKIALNTYTSFGEQDKVLEIARKIVSIQPNPAHRRKLGEILQSMGQVEEALLEYENIASDLREQKEYDKLLKIYELIAPHKPDNRSMIKDMCILYLRKQDPNMAIRTMERYKVDADSEFATLFDKAKLMKKALARPNIPGSKAQKSA